MKFRLISRFHIGLASAFLLMASGAPAFAHHMMGGALPASFQDGLLSGLGHPVIGLDHFAFIIGLGVASAFLRRGFVPIAAFILATIAGCALHLKGVTLPAAEILIAASVLLAGAAIMSGRGLSAALATLIFAVSGLFHGYAYGESIFGAEETPLTAYLIGFAAIQFVIASTAMLIMRRAFAERAASAMPARLTGAIIVGVGLTFLAQNVESLVIPEPDQTEAPRS